MNRGLADLARDYWDGYLAANPSTATMLGDHRHDDRLEDISPAGMEKERARIRAVLERARAIDAALLTDPDCITLGALIVEAEGQLDMLSCGFEEWVVDPLGGPQVSFMSLPELTRIATPDDALHYIGRCRAMGPYVDQLAENLKRGLAAGKTASIDAVKKTLGELEQLDALAPAEWTLATPSRDAHDDWTPERRNAFARDLVAAIADIVKPAFARYRDCLRDEIAPAARPQEKAGLSFLPGGVDAYRKMIRLHTSLDLSPEEIHATGLEHVARFRRDLAELGAKALGTSDVTEIQNRLRDDPRMHFATADEVEAKAEEALARAGAAIPGWFGVLPKAGCVVRVMSEIESPNSTIAYYRQPAADGSRPGTYMINTYLPETRPRYEAEALAFHESIPGHHLQIAIAQELTGLPEFRRHQGVTSYVEGWALYTERLADEMGLYSGDLDRIGMLSYDAWRSCRLVVDTGLHALGWSRERAIEYMIGNSILALNNIENEVDRYLTWPGQALAYKLGQIEILKLRAEAEDRLGARFDVRTFHDAVLENGAVALPVLRERVEAWVKANG